VIITWVKISAIQASNLSMAGYMQILTGGHNLAMFGSLTFEYLAYSHSGQLSNNMMQPFMGGGDNIHRLTLAVI